jgi:hypothetical protein
VQAWYVPEPNWEELEDAHGSAEDLPDLLAGLSPDRQSPAWSELWDRVCHQYSTFSASPHVLPFLLAAAQRWPPESRAMPLALAGGIVAAPETDLDGHRPVVEQLRQVALDTLQNADLDPTDRVYVVQSAMAFAGDSLWGHTFERLNDGEFMALCPACGEEVLVVIGEESFCAAEDWATDAESRRTAITSKPPEELTGAGRTLYALCADSEIGESVCQIFGVSTCPHCAEQFEIADAVAAYEEQ